MADNNSQNNHIADAIHHLRIQVQKIREQDTLRDAQLQTLTNNLKENQTNLAKLQHKIRESLQRAQNLQQLAITKPPKPPDPYSSSLSVGVVVQQHVSRILTVSIHNPWYTITEEVLHCVFDPYGSNQILHIDPVGDSIKASIEFQSQANAMAAQNALQGRCIYSGCCQLSIELAAESTIYADVQVQLAGLQAQLEKQPYPYINSINEQDDSCDESDSEEAPSLDNEAPAAKVFVKTTKDASVESGEDDHISDMMFDEMSKSDDNTSPTVEQMLHDEYDFKNDKAEELPNRLDIGGSSKCLSLESVELLHDPTPKKVPPDIAPESAEDKDVQDMSTFSELEEKQLSAQELFDKTPDRDTIDGPATFDVYEEVPAVIDEDMFVKLPERERNDDWRCITNRLEGISKTELNNVEKLFDKMSNDEMQSDLCVFKENKFDIPEFDNENMVFDELPESEGHYHCDDVQDLHNYFKCVSDNLVATESLDVHLFIPELEINDDAPTDEHVVYDEYDFKDDKADESPHRSDMGRSSKCLSLESVELLLDPAPKKVPPDIDVYLEDDQQANYPTFIFWNESATGTDVVGISSFREVSTSISMRPLFLPDFQFMKMSSTCFKEDVQYKNNLHCSDELKQVMPKGACEEGTKIPQTFDISECPNMCRSYLIILSLMLKGNKFSYASRRLSFHDLQAVIISWGNYFSHLQLTEDLIWVELIDPRITNDKVCYEDKVVSEGFNVSWNQLFDPGISGNELYVFMGMRSVCNPLTLILDMSIYDSTLDASRTTSDCVVGVNVPVQNAYGMPLKAASITENCNMEGLLLLGVKRFHKEGNAIEKLLNSWSRECFTMDEKRSKAMTKALVRLYKEGLLYRDVHFVNRDCVLSITISDIEVDYKDIKEKTALKVFGYESHVELGALTSFIDPLEGALGDIVVTTTRVEAMLEDIAIAIHPKASLAKYSDHIVFTEASSVAYVPQTSWMYKAVYLTALQHDLDEPLGFDTEIGVQSGQTKTSRFAFPEIGKQEHPKKSEHELNTEAELIKLESEFETCDKDYSAEEEVGHSEFDELEQGIPIDKQRNTLSNYVTKDKTSVMYLEPGSDTLIADLLLVHGLFFGFKLEVDHMEMDRYVNHHPWDPGITFPPRFTFEVHTEIDLRHGNLGNIVLHYWAITYLGTSMFLAEGNVMALEDKDLKGKGMSWPLRTTHESKHTKPRIMEYEQYKKDKIVIAFTNSAQLVVVFTF